jgi:hypothetical protein
MTAEERSDATDVTAPVDAAPAPRSSGRARSVIASILGVLAVLLLVVTLVAVWARVTVLRSDKVAELVGDAIEEPDVQAALATLLADQVQQAVGLEDRLVALLPDQLDRFAAPLAAGANAAVQRAFTRALGEPAVQDVITTLVERAHERAMRLLRGDGLVDGVTVVDGAVTLNLLPLVARGLTELQRFGLLDGVDVPELTADGNPDEQVAQLSTALDRDLPAGFGQLVVYDSERIADAQEMVREAQRILVLAQRAVWAAAALALVLVVATILVSPRRLRGALVLAVGIAGAMVVLRVAARQVVAGAGDLAARPGGKAAIRAVLGGASEGLIRLAGLILLLALVGAAAVVLARKRWLDDLVIVGAVLLGAVTVAVLGLSIWSLALGVVVGLAVPFVVRRIAAQPAAGSGSAGPPLEPAPSRAAGPPLEPTPRPQTS